MADFPATPVVFTPCVDDSVPGEGDGTEVVANLFNAGYGEIEAIAAHLGSGEAVAAMGGDWHEVSDAVTNAVTDGDELGHITSGAAAAGFGVARRESLEDDGGTKRLGVARRIVMWAEPEAANYLPLIIEEALDAGVVAGRHYKGAVKAVDDTARTIIPDCSRDVAAALLFDALIKHSDGIVDSARGIVENNSSWTVYEDESGNVLTLAIAADGSATLQRTAGEGTFDVVWSGKGM